MERGGGDLREEACVLGLLLWSELGEGDRDAVGEGSGEGGEFSARGKFFGVGRGDVGTGGHHGWEGLRLRECRGVD